MDQNQSKIDQFNQNGQKRSSFLTDCVIFDGLRSIFKLLINILIQNGFMYYVCTKNEENCTDVVKFADHVNVKENLFYIRVSNMVKVNILREMLFCILCLHDSGLPPC